MIVPTIYETKFTTIISLISDDGIFHLTLDPETHEFEFDHQSLKRLSRSSISINFIDQLVKDINDIMLTDGLPGVKAYLEDKFKIKLQQYKKEV
jgi:hypothetical protein